MESDFRIDIADDTLAALAHAAGGDARIALNALELAVQSAHPEPVEGPGAKGVRKVSLADIEEALQHRAALYDRAGDWHYDIASAFIKSLRGSDPDAALYWLARMLEGGEDPLFVARRLVILASEDVGLADPQALQVAVAAQQAVHFIGMPEGFYPLAEATIYLATAPKSNSAGAAYGRALDDAKATLNEPVPLHLRNPATPLMRDLGYGRDYKYDHSFPEHHSGQQHEWQQRPDQPGGWSRLRLRRGDGQGLLAHSVTSKKPSQPSSANSLTCAWNMNLPGYLKPVSRIARSPCASMIVSVYSRVSRRVPVRYTSK